MVMPQSSDTRHIIVAGLEKIQQLKSTQEDQFVQALQKGRVKLTLDNGTILSIRVAPDSNQKHESIRDLLQQVQDHNVIFSIATDQKKEYFFSNATHLAEFQNKISKTGKEKIFSMLDEKTKEAIATHAAELMSEKSEIAPEHKAAKTDEHAVAAPTTTASPLKTSPTPIQEVISEAPVSTQTADTAVMEGRKDALDAEQLDEERSKANAKREKEAEATEKRDRINRTEEKKQEERRELQTDRDQAGDKGSFNEELLKPPVSSSPETEPESPTKQTEVP